MTREELIAFTDEIAALFNDAKIPHPVHLSDGNENALIRIFQGIEPTDWVCCSWRAHYQCLLHGVPRETLREAIMRGDSIALCFPEHRILSSAIVGGILPIALGIALSIKRRGGNERVHCFIGDMTAETGMAHETMKYARNHGLPITWIVEDNAISVCTPTAYAWGGVDGTIGDVRFEYQSQYPHAGAGRRIQF